MIRESLTWFTLALFTAALAGCASSTGTRSKGPLTLAGDSWMFIPGAKVSYLDKQLWKAAPEVPGPGDKDLFADYRADGKSTWSSNWTRRLDFTGVAWDDPKAGVLIHPQYLICASHFPRRLGSSVVFHDRQGHPVIRVVTARKRIGRAGYPDVTVMRLDRPVPAAVSHYPILPPGYDYRLLNGAKLLVTDQERKVHLFRINRVNTTVTYELLGARKALPSELDPRWHEHLEKGDSGNPSFLIIDGRLVLVSTLRGGGWGAKGPFYGGRRVQLALEAAIAVLEREAER